MENIKTGNRIFFIAGKKKFHRVIYFLTPDSIINKNKRVTFA